MNEIFVTLAECLARVPGQEDSAMVPGLLMQWKIDINLISEYVQGSETGEL